MVAGVYLLIGIVMVSSLRSPSWTLREHLLQEPWPKMLATPTRRLQNAGIQVAPNSPPRQLADNFSISATRTKLDLQKTDLFEPPQGSPTWLTGSAAYLN